MFVGSGEGVLVNDTDADGDPLTAVVVQPAEHGQLGLQPGGAFVYLPDSDYHGTDHFTYAARDFRDSEPVTVTIEVRPTQDLAEGQADHYKALPTAVLQTDLLSGVLANDRNIDQVPISAQLHSDVSFGELVLNNDGSFTYDAQGTAGLATFSYRILDRGQLSAPVPVLIVVNAPPTAANDAFSVAEDSLLERTAENGLAANDQDRDGDRLRVSLIDSPTHGELLLDEFGAFEYRPASDFAGTDQFTYTVSDGIDISNVATVTLAVTEVNDLPQVQGEAYFASPGELFEIAAERGVLANDSDVEDQELTATLSQMPRHGSLSFVSNGSFQYRPEAGFVGVDEFVYVARDSDHAQVSGTVRLYVGTSPVRVSEVMAANASVLQTSTRSTPTGRFDSNILTPDWIELENTSDGAIEIGDFYLTDNEQLPRQWRIPPGTVIPAQGHLVILATRLDIADPRLDELGLLHTNFKVNSGGGEYLGLSSPDGTVVDAFDELPESAPDVSYGRQNGSIGFLSEPTPGRANAELLLGVVTDVVFSATRGFYDVPVEIELSVSTPDASIYYTLDGSLPTPAAGMAYEQPITIDRTTNVRAAAYKEDYVPSRTGTHSYFFVADILQQPADPEGFPDRWGRAGGADYEMDPRIASDETSGIYDPDVAQALTALPTVSLTMNVEDFFGTTGIQSNPQNRGDLWERATSVEFIDFAHFENAQVRFGHPHGWECEPESRSPQTQHASGVSR